MAPSSWVRKRHCLSLSLSSSAHILFLCMAGSTIQRRMTTTTSHPPLTPLWSQEWWSVVSRWVGGQRNKRPNHLELLSSWVPVIFYQYNLATRLPGYVPEPHDDDDDGTRQRNGTRSLGLWPAELNIAVVIVCRQIRGNKDCNKSIDFIFNAPPGWLLPSLILLCCCCCCCVAHTRVLLLVAGCSCCSSTRTHMLKATWTNCNFCQCRKFLKAINSTICTESVKECFFSTRALVNIKTHCFGVVHGTGHGEEKCPPLCVVSWGTDKTWTLPCSRVGGWCCCCCCFIAVPWSAPREWGLHEKLNAALTSQQ